MDVFDVQRELVDVWKDFFCFETIPDSLSSHAGYGWNFSNVQDAFEENGVLHGQTVYLFCSPQTEFMYCIGGGCKVIHIPVIVAIQCPFAPSDTVAVDYEEKEDPFEQKIVHMKDLKLDWIPYISTAKRHESSRIFMLSCEDREFLGYLKSKKGLRDLTPYLYVPRRENCAEQSSVVRYKYPSVQRLREGLTPRGIGICEKMSLYKFYPVATPDNPSFPKNSFINRYYGHAHQVL